MALVPRATASTLPEPYVVPPSQEFDGNDGSWSTFKINVGTPGQDFRVLASTASGETYVVVPEGCLKGDGADCPNLRGADIFNSVQNSGFQVNESSTWSTIGQYDITLESKLNYTASGLFGYDKVSLGWAADSSAVSLDHQVVGGIGELSYWMGYLPLGIADSSFSSLSQSIDSFMYQLRNGTKIPSLSFGYTAGAKYRLKSVFGSLILGGYDSTRFTPNQNDFSFSFSTDPSRLLTVGVESIMAMNSLKGTYSLTSSAHFSMIDSSVPHLWLPTDICDNFEQAFGLTYDNTTDLYLVNDTIHEQLKSKNPSITIKLVNSLQDTSVNYTNIVLPYAAFDLQASYPYYPNATNYFPIRRAANDSQYVLGRTLLQEAYLIVDYERANFSIAQAAFPDPLPAANIITIQPLSTPKSASSKPPLSTGAIAGIAAGGAILIILLTGAIILFLLRRRRKPIREKSRYELSNTQISETGYETTHAQKTERQPQELGGTALAELASPRHDEHKPFLSPTNVPQEMPNTPMAPRWEEVTAASYYEMDASAPASQVGSRAPSDDGRGTVGISPLARTTGYRDR
ncbi:acid protease [Lophiostoma macrostomum CBS 122681]|uniref:Acid protease n=1 Tax=Lophiostoma macrostomum CBS 122681 TaxID=1314788 RepID=A0A6A6SKX8_9PLEO|nr:acid protease [Lophiostoma macrostomum CBS 122681]